jgi:hypothetical protein
MKSHRFFILAISLLLAVCICSSKETKNIRNAVLAEVKKYPKLEIQDLYKLAYEAAMGNEHIMSDTVAVGKYLEDELASVDTLSEEPLIEYLTSDSSIARVNLRALKTRKMNSKKLLQAMVQTAHSVKPSTDLLRQFWKDIESLAEEGKMPFTKEELSSYFNDIEQNKLPAVDHSKAVEGTYHPAYRIVDGKLFSIQ